MKRILCLMAFFYAFLSFMPPDVQAQKTEIKNFTATTGDSINDITGTDTTHYVAVRGNSDWSITVSAGTITGSGGKLQVVVSNDGTYWGNYPDTNSVNKLFYDTIASARRYVFTAPSCPYLYIGIKATKGTCSGKYWSTFVMKKPE